MEKGAVKSDQKVKGCNSGGCSTGGCNRLNVYDWFADIPLAFSGKTYNVVEVSFKQGARKSFYRNTKGIDLIAGDSVVVEAAQGYDIGEVSLTGELVKLQMKKKRVKDKSDTIRNVIRIPSEEDNQTFEKAKSKEREALIKARVIARQMKLEMKIGDVEFQADNKKVTFYYTAEDRVDFRELVKEFAKTFKVKIEMRQIGSRQEAGRIGGIGTCGRELCCSTWLTDFKSVSTGAARYQNLAINSDKLSGQCGRLKCCLNYELNTYMDALKDIPKHADKLRTEEGTYFLRKTEIFKKVMWYSLKDSRTLHKLELDKVREVQHMNKSGKKPSSLLGYTSYDEEPVKESKDALEDLVGSVSLKTLDKVDKKKRRRKGKQNNNKPNNKGKSNNNRRRRR